MYYKRLQKYGKKLVAAILTSALILASGQLFMRRIQGNIWRRKIFRKRKV